MIFVVLCVEVLTLRAPAVHSGPELLLPQATSVTILQNACATLVD